MKTSQIEWEVTEQVKEHAWYEASKDYRVTLKPTRRTSEVTELTIKGSINGALTFGLVWDGTRWAQLCYYPKNVLWPIIANTLFNTYDEIRDDMINRVKESSREILKLYTD